MIRSTLALLFGITVSCSVFAQDRTEIGAELLKSFGQGYNGNKVAVRGESFRAKNSFSIGITYQLASQKSYSVSTGFGIYGGYRYAFSDNINGNSPFAGARLLFSFENFHGKSTQNSLLFTPMGELGYHLSIGKRIYTAPAVGFGYTLQLTGDFNSLNEDVGKRWIPSLSAGLKF